VRRSAPKPPDDGRMSLVEHLYELRNRLAKSLLALAVAMVVVFVLWEPLFEVLRQPYCEVVGDEECKLYATGVFEEFKVRLRVAAIGGVVAAAPVWLYQVGAFITPALHRKEKRYAGGFLAASLTFFLLGALFAYLTVSRGLEFLLEVGGEGVVNLPSVQSYLSFVTLTLLAFGIAFEFPVVLMFLNIVGVLSSARMRAWRRGMIVAIFAAAAVLTPSTDPYSFLAMALPLYVLYEVCIVLSRVRERALRRRHPEADYSGLSDDEASPLDTSASRL
jgi:sec-independent protein translocase protein TatC